MGLNDEYVEELVSPKSPKLQMSSKDSQKNTIIAAVSNLSTAYNLTVINVVHVMVENQYCGGDKCASQVDLASTSVLVGAILGQLTFGYVGDLLGRGIALQLTMALSILGAAASAFAVPLTDDKSTIFTFLAITRFVLGVGVGGVYPLSATIASESSDKNSRGTSASLVFSMQGVAFLLVPLVAMALIKICGDPGVSTFGGNTGWSWRLALGMGAVPGLLLAPFKAKETSRKVTDNEPQSPVSPKAAPQLSLMEALQMREYWGKLIGTAGGWFLFDITFYGNSLFQSTVLREVFKSASYKGGPSPITGDLRHNVISQIAVVAAIGLPGYYVAVYFMDKLGRKTIQLQGFFFMALAFGVLGGFVNQLEDVPGLMLFIYGLTFFFSNFGPNTTTFILPAETFPPHLRGTMNGFSAALGKVGATLGSALFKPLDAHTSLGFTMGACAAVSLVGFAVTWFFVEDKLGMDMEGDDEEEEEVADPSYEAFANNETEV